MTDPERSIAILLHEVRSPVAALAAIAQASDGADVAARQELIRLCVAACAAIQRLVTDITVASVRPIRADVGAIVRDAALAHSLARAGTGPGVEVHVDSSLPLVCGDPVRLRQAIDNLLTNAAVHGGSGVIDVGVRGTASGVVVSVADSGSGIASDELGRIFEPGVRLDASRQGAGLGLAITRAIVEAHGGSLTAESLPGRGATFTVTLPHEDGAQPVT